VQRLTPHEADRREREIRKHLGRAAKYYPFAAGQLNHWLDGKGKQRYVSKKQYDFTDPRWNVLPQMLKNHGPVFKDGIKERLQKGHWDYLTPGKPHKLYRQTSLEARFFRNNEQTNSKEWDLSIGMHGFQIASEMKVLRQVKNPFRVDVISWRFQMWDSLDWIIDAPALIPVPKKVDIEKFKQQLTQLPIPPETYDLTESVVPQIPSWVTVKDTWFLEVEVSSDAHWFELFTEIFEVPKKILNRIK